MHEVVARTASARGEVVLRRGDDDALELRVNGVFVMDSVHTATERLLARRALELVEQPARVLVGGLGLGYTVRELLADDRVTTVLVAEIEPAVPAWMRAGTLPGSDLLANPRVEVTVVDVRDLVTACAPHSLDAILLDVDNGPGHLVHDVNAAVYAEQFLACCRERLRPSGIVTIWSAAATPELEATMTKVFGGCRVEEVPVELQGRAESYWLFRAPARGAGPR